jgi:hypothetical protein
MQQNDRRIRRVCGIYSTTSTTSHRRLGLKETAAARQLRDPLLFTNSTTVRY